MRATLLLKLVVLVLSVIAVIYGISIVLQSNNADKHSNQPPATLNTITPDSKLTSAQPSAPHETEAESSSAPSIGKEPDTKEDTYKVAAKKSVQFLEEGNPAQSQIEMRVAIGMASKQGAPAAQLDVLRNMLMRIEYCKAGPEAMLAWLATSEAALVDTDVCGVVSIDRVRMKIEALVAMGKLQESWDESKNLLACFTKPGSAQMKEALALEQAIRIAGMAGANEQIANLETRLRATVEAGIALKTLQDPQLPLATLGTLAKMRGDCATAIKLYNQALEGFDINQWLREKRVAPWRLQVLALVAMDRVDCLRQVGQIERAKGSASVLSADLATALGEQDPLAMQAADQRDQILYAPMSP